MYLKTNPIYSDLTKESIFKLFFFENKCTYIKEVKNITKHDAVYRCNVSLTIQEKVLLSSLV